MTFKDIKEGASIYIIDKSQIDQDKFISINWEEF